MADQLRHLTRPGVEAFRGYLNELRAGSHADAPRHLLTDRTASEPIETPIAIEQKTFATRLEAARYLTPLLESISGVAEDVGLWSWLSLYYFDQACPRLASGTRRPGRDYRHILEPWYPYAHRHLLAGAYLVYALHGEGSQLVLYTRPQEESWLFHELASRQVLVSNRAVLAAASALYLDERTGRPKRGVLTDDARGGSALRFTTVIQQLDVNFDLHSMTAEGILSLLPAEFDRWKAPRRKGIRRRVRE